MLMHRCFFTALLKQGELQSPNCDQLYENNNWINDLLQGFLHMTLVHFKKCTLSNYIFYYKLQIFSSNKLKCMLKLLRITFFIIIKIEIIISAYLHFTQLEEKAYSGILFLFLTCTRLRQTLR